MVLQELGDTHVMATLRAHVVELVPADLELVPADELPVLHLDDGDPSGAAPAWVDVTVDVTGTQTITGGPATAWRATRGRWVAREVDPDRLPARAWRACISPLEYPWSAHRASHRFVSGRADVVPARWHRSDPPRARSVVAVELAVGP